MLANRGLDLDLLRPLPTGLFPLVTRYPVNKDGALGEPRQLVIPGVSRKSPMLLIERAFNRRP